MADRFPGGVISKTPPTVVAPVDGEGGSASGVWTLEEQLGLQKAGSWPKGILPRELYAWGYGANGRLGDGTTVNKSSPVQVGALTNWAQAAAGNSMTACVTTAGTLFTWGQGTHGQLGDGTTIDKSSPIQIGALTNWAHPSVGNFSVACIKTDGALFTWGFNYFGQLGHNNTVYLSSPVQVGALTTWAQVSVAEGSDTFAITTDGEIYSWGRNNYGSLGLGNSGISRSSPVQIGALNNWAVVSGGNMFCVAVKTDGTMWSWGNNTNGRLGHNTTGVGPYRADKSSPVQIGALTNWRQPSGGNSACFAIKTDNTIWSWGDAINGGLGNGTSFPDKSSPVQIGALSNWSQVSAKQQGAVAVKTDGTLFSWGAGVQGQNGDGSAQNLSSPVQVGALTDWVQVAAGRLHVVARTRG